MTPPVPLRFGSLSLLWRPRTAWVCAALAAQVCGPDDDHLLHAAVLGAWLCGRAAEHEVFGSSGSPESLSATAVIGNLGPAFRALRSSWI